MTESSTESTQPTELMEQVRRSLKTMRNIVGNETALTEEREEQLQQLERLEQLLIDQEAKLDGVNKVLEEFNYSVSHELFAPLRRISGFTREIQHRYGNQLDMEGIGQLNEILDSSQQMNDLIEALIQVSRLPHADLQIARVDLTEIATAIANELKQKSPRRRVEFAIRARVEARGDACLLKMVMRRLLENAWRFTAPRENGRIEFGECSIEGQQVFYVRDNGVGFDMADYDRLFRPFQRLHDRGTFPGNGLGLIAVKRIIDRHGGRVWAEALPERGATFYFTLAR